MRTEAYSQVLYALAEGIHPVTGNILPDGLIDQPDVIRALYAGARMLETGNQSIPAAIPVTGSREPNTRKPSAEMPEPAERVPDAANTEPDAVNREPEARKPDAATQEPEARKPSSAKSSDRPAPKPGRENAGKAWSKEDDVLLMESYAAGMSVNTLAKTFKRSAFAIEARIEKLETSQPGTQTRAFRIIRSSGTMDAGGTASAPGNPAAVKTP